MMNNYKRTIEKISKVIEKSENIYLSSHINPDGDSIGSLMALELALEQLNKNVYFINTDNIPRNLGFLPYIEKLQDYNDVDADILFILDCGNRDRIGEYEKYIDKAKHVVNIDHHLDNNNFGDVNLVDANRSSTGEIIF